jgi:hypothetical protein
MTPADIPELDWQYELKRDVLRALPLLIPLLLLVSWLAR